MRLLIVTDGFRLERSMNRFFTSKGYEVDLYQSGNILLGSSYPKPNIFILDRHASGVEIIDICNYLKHQPTTSHIPIIIISAAPANATGCACEAADSFLEKPFRNNTLLNMIEAEIGVLH